MGHAKPHDRGAAVQMLSHMLRCNLVQFETLISTRFQKQMHRVPVVFPGVGVSDAADEELLVGKTSRIPSGDDRRLQSLQVDLARPARAQC